jgi:hypothetical protein
LLGRLAVLHLFIDGFAEFVRRVHCQDAEPRGDGFELFLPGDAGRLDGAQVGIKPLGAKPLPI